MNGIRSPAETLERRSSRRGPQVTGIGTSGRYRALKRYLDSSYLGLRRSRPILWPREGDGPERLDQQRLRSNLLKLVSKDLFS